MITPGYNHTGITISRGRAHIYDDNGLPYSLSYNVYVIRDDWERQAASQNDDADFTIVIVIIIVKTTAGKKGGKNAALPGVSLSSTVCLLIVAWWFGARDPARRPRIRIEAPARNKTLGIARILKNEWFFDLKGKYAGRSNLVTLTCSSQCHASNGCVGYTITCGGPTGSKLRSGNEKQLVKGATRSGWRKHEWMQITKFLFKTRETPCFSTILERIVFWSDSAAAWNEYTYARCAVRIRARNFARSWSTRTRARGACER